MSLFLKLLSHSTLTFMSVSVTGSINQNVFKWSCVVWLRYRFCIMPLYERANVFSAAVTHFHVIFSGEEIYWELVFAMFVDTFLVNGGLNQITFLRRFLFPFGAVRSECLSSQFVSKLLHNRFLKIWELFCLKSKFLGSIQARI